MDEPFGAIDPINREIIQDEFLKMQQELKKTIMFVSHDIDEAIKMADRIAIFRDGRLEQYDTPDDLLAHPADDFIESFVGEDRTLKRLRLAKVLQVMDHSMVSMKPQDSLAEALQKMDSLKYDHEIAVVDDQQKPIGYISRSVAQKEEGLCGDHLVPLTASVSKNDDLRSVVSTMFKYDMTWLPCVNAQSQFIGYISQQGITHYLGATYRQPSA